MQGDWLRLAEDLARDPMDLLGRLLRLRLGGDVSVVQLCRHLEHSCHLGWVLESLIGPDQRLQVCSHLRGGEACWETWRLDIIN